MSQSFWSHGLHRVGFPSCTISRSLLKFMSIESVMPSNHLVLWWPFFCPQSFPASVSFPMSQLFVSGGQSIGASASVLPMNIQVWFPLGLAGLIFLQSKGLSRIFITIIGKYQFFGSQPSLWSNSHIHTWLLEKNIALTRWTFVSKVMSLKSLTMVAFLSIFSLQICQYFYILCALMLSTYILIIVITFCWIEPFFII